MTPLGVAAFTAASRVPFADTAAAIATATPEQLAGDHRLRMAVLCSPQCDALRRLVVERRDHLAELARSETRSAEIARARSGAA